MASQSNLKQCGFKKYLVGQGLPILTPHTPIHLPSGAALPIALPSDTGCSLASPPGSPSCARSKLSLQRIYVVEMSCKEMAAAGWQGGLGGGKKAISCWLLQASGIELS